MMGVAGSDAPHELSPKYAIQAVEQDEVESKTYTCCESTDACMCVHCALYTQAERVQLGWPVPFLN